MKNILYGKRKGIGIASAMIALTVLGLVIMYVLNPLIYDIQRSFDKARFQDAYNFTSNVTRTTVAHLKGSMASTSYTDYHDFFHALEGAFAKDIALACYFGHSEQACYNNVYSYDYLNKNGVEYMGSGPGAGRGYLWNNGKVFYYRIYDPDECPYTGSVAGYGAGQCGTVAVDSNGASGPNIWGRDFFKFAIFPDGSIKPQGYTQSDSNILNQYHGCKNTKTGAWCGAAYWRNLL